MALITCPHCGKQMSDRADVCPHCGKMTKIKELVQKEQKSSASVYKVIIGLFFSGLFLILRTGNGSLVSLYKHDIRFGWDEFFLSCVIVFLPLIIAIVALCYIIKSKSKRNIWIATIAFIIYLMLVFAGAIISF